MGQRIITPIDAWFVLEVPIQSLRVQRDHRTQEPWVRALVEDIRANGLKSPLIVDNRDKATTKRGAMRVGVGMNRARCMQELGWRVAPCIIYGELPVEFKKTAISTPSLAAIQTYITDGEVYQEHDASILLRGAHKPENMLQPPRGDRTYVGVSREMRYG